VLASGAGKGVIEDGSVNLRSRLVDADLVARAIATHSKYRPGKTLFYFPAKAAKG